MEVMFMIQCTKKKGRVGWILNLRTDNILLLLNIEELVEKTKLQEETGAYENTQKKIQPISITQNGEEISLLEPQNAEQKAITLTIQIS